MSEVTTSYLKTFIDYYDLLFSYCEILCTYQCKLRGGGGVQARGGDLQIEI